MLQIRCKNNNVTKSFAEGASLLDVYQRTTGTGDCLALDSRDMSASRN